jgi:hypothetical protein
MYDYASILRKLERNVRTSYDLQVLVPSLETDGAFIEDATRHPVANHGNHAQRLAQAGMVYLADGSALHGDDELFDRLLRGIAF